MSCSYDWLIGHLPQVAVHVGASGSGAVASVGRVLVKLVYTLVDAAGHVQWRGTVQVILGLFKHVCEEGVGVEDAYFNNVSRRLSEDQKKRTDVGTGQGWGKQFQQSPGQRVATVDELLDNDAPFSGVSLGSPVGVWPRVCRVQGSLVQRYHL